MRNRVANLLRLVVSGASIALSALLLYGAISVLLGGGVTLLLAITVWGTLVYAIASFVLLLLAWATPSPVLSRVMGIAVVLYLAIFFLGSMDVGMISGQELALLLVASVLLLAQWLHVRLVATRGKTPNLPLQRTAVSGR